MYLLHPHASLRAASLLRHNTERLSSFLAAGGKYSHLWIACWPTSPELSLTDVEYKIAAAIRIGVSPIQSPITRCQCGEALSDSNSFHFLYCRLLKAKAITSRHDRVVRTLANHALPHVAYTKIEPHSLTDRKRADLHIEFNTRNPLITDVTIISHMAPTHSQHLLTKKLLSTIDSLDHKAFGKQASKAINQLLRTSEMSKENKHSADAKARGGEFIPFVMSASGGWSGSSLNFIKALDRGADYDEQDLQVPFLRGIRREVAMQIQRGNARIVLDGTRLASASL